MPYTPRRDHRFEYVWEAIENIEEHDCVLGCQRATAADEEMPGNGCSILTDIMLEKPVQEIDDLGDKGLYCTVRVPLAQPENENQEKLF